jgi:acylphosphatase
MTRRFVVSGHVQGVGFRWYVARHARSLGLAGYARNMADGRVEVLVTGGDAATMVRLETLLRAGPMGAKVESVVQEDRQDDPQVPTRSFDIR